MDKTKDFSESLPAHALNNFFFREICAHRTFFLHVLRTFCADYTCEKLSLTVVVRTDFVSVQFCLQDLYFSKIIQPLPPQMSNGAPLILFALKGVGGGGGARVAGMQALYPSKLKFKIILSLSLSLPSLKHDDFILV